MCQLRTPHRATERWAPISSPTCIILRAAVPFSPPLVARLCALALTASLLASTGCAAIFPRQTTIYREVPAGLAERGELTPAPDFVHRLSVLRAELPRLTRDAREWDNDAGPDAFVVVYRNGAEIFRSRTIQNTLRPEWNPARDFADVRIHDNDQLRIELRDDDGIVSDLVGLAEVRGVPNDARNGGIWNVRLEGGASVQLQSNPPPPRLGMGVTYDFRDDVLVVLEVEEAGPAYAGGLRAGDRITAVDTRPISSLGEGGSRQAMNGGAMREIHLTVSRAGSSTVVDVRRDACYPSR